MEKFYAVLDRNNDSKANEVLVLAETWIYQITFRNGSLYVAEISRVILCDNIESHTPLKHFIFYFTL